MHTEEEVSAFGVAFFWGGCKDLHIIPKRTVNDQAYRDVMLDTYVSLSDSVIGDVFVLKNDNARPHRIRIVDDYLQQDIIMLMEWPARFSDLKSIEPV